MSILLTAVEKSYLQGAKNFDIIRGIDLKFQKGKWYTIYGASGSGKSTLLNITGGLERPDSGNVFYKEKDIYLMKDFAISRWRNLKIGFVFQIFHLISDLNVEDNIKLPAFVNNMPVDNNWLRTITETLDIEGLLSRNPSSLSGGEKQRVALARAVINKPDFILADEPTGNLDLKNTENVIKLLLDLIKTSGIGVILATHENELMEVGDFKFRLKDGVLKEK